MAKDIISLELDSKDNIIQESSVVITTMDAVAIMDITVNAVILDNAGIANNSCAWCSNRHE